MTDLARARSVLIWAGATAAVTGPLALAAASPLLAWREPVYIVAGFAGVVALALLLVQPLLAGGHLPGLQGWRGRAVHGRVGLGLATAVMIHVLGLWWTSPPDVVDALLFRSPTPFSAWGVIAMWAVLATALLAAFRRRLALRPALWRLYHAGLALVIVAGGVVHAVLIEGTMEPISKTALCLAVSGAALKVVADARPWAVLMRARG